MSDAIAAAATSLDVVEIGRGGARGGAPVAAPPLGRRARRPAGGREARALRLDAASPAPSTTAASPALLTPYFELANIVMLFLLAVVLVGVQWGRGPAIARGDR